MPSALASLALLGAFEGSAPAGDPTAVEAFLAAHCVRCHEGERPKGKFSLEPGRRPERWLHSVLERLDARDMPPDGEPRPDDAAYAAAAAGVRAELGTAEQRPAPAPLRRLSREELRRALRDAFGVDDPSVDAMPADDVGHGFDNNADVQRAPPLWVERLVDVAERVAASAVRDPRARQARSVTYGPDALSIERTTGARSATCVSLFSSGAAAVRHEALVDGRARITATVSGQQAGPQKVRIDVTVDGRRAGSFDVPQVRDAPGQFSCEIPMVAGQHAIEVRFTNDYFMKDAPPAERDRNCNVHAVTVLQPLEAPPPTALESWLDGVAGQDVRARIAAMLGRAWRIDADEARMEAERMVGAARTASGSVAPGPVPDHELMRMAVAAAIVSPRFAYAGSAADRLALFLWSSIPDEPLLEAERSGALGTEPGLRAEVDRMLGDPRASALAERFAVQWLQVGRLAHAQPDPAMFEGVDRALLDAMHSETVLYLDAVLRERRGIGELLESDFGFMDERLARHYGVPGVRGSGMRRVPLARGSGGVLRQASMLTATSHPTATSPAKRGKWVMEALLDAPPPPAPPGVPAIPPAADGASRPMREALAAHRADPNCSPCHVVMDAIGLAFEARDATGRIRASDGGVAIDDRTQMPDGTEIAGVSGVFRWVSADPRFVRAVVRHLATYGLGRGLKAEDGPAIDAAVAAVRADPTLWQAVHRVARIVRDASAPREPGAQRAGGPA